MSWRGTSGNYKARWTGYRTDRRAWRYAARPCPRLVCILPFQNTREKYGKCQGNGGWFGAPVKTGEQSCVKVSDDEANMGVRSTHGTSSEWPPWHKLNRIISTQNGGYESPSLHHWQFLLMGLTRKLSGAAAVCRVRCSGWLYVSPSMVRHTNNSGLLRAHIRQADENVLCHTDQ